jgi:hypothetical protein
LRNAWRSRALFSLPRCCAGEGEDKEQERYVLPVENRLKRYEIPDVKFQSDVS